MRRTLVRYLVSVLLVVLAVAGGLPAAAQERPGATPKERSVMSFDLEFRQGFDDNANNQGDASPYFELSPRMRFRQQRKHGFWSLDYRPTLRQFSQFARRDRFDHRVFFNSSWDLSKRWSVDFKQSWLRSSNPFLRLGESGGELSSSDVFLGPNQGFVGPDRRFSQWRSELTFHYQLGRYSRLNFGADYYRDDQANGLFPDSDSRALRFEYEKQYTKNKSWALMYSMQNFRLEAAHYRVRSQSLFFTHSYQFRPGTRWTLFAGPQFSRVQANPSFVIDLFLIRLRLKLRVDEPVYGLAVGTILSHRFSDRTGLDFQLSQRVAEGGSFTGATLHRFGRLNLRHRFTRRLSMSWAAYLTDNRSLGGVGLRELSSGGFTSGFDYALNRRLSLRGEYQFSRFGTGSPELRSLLQRNRFYIGLKYSFDDISLGR